MNGGSPVEQEIRALIREHGRITFARFMQACLYSRRGGFYASRGESIGAHFGTSSMSHPVFGALIARQLEQMWRLLGEPPIFHAIEAGSGDGSLARSIVQACLQMDSGFERALCYAASDYAPRWLHAFDRAGGCKNGTADTAPPTEPFERLTELRRVQADGVAPFRNIVGCILSNELIDNFPVHRFEIRDGKVREVFVTLDAGRFCEVLDEPSTPRLGERLDSLGLRLNEGYRGEVSLALENWCRQLSRALERGFVLTIDYGDLAPGLYGPDNSNGTLVCYRRHVAGADPYEHIGEQDITCHVDFTSLMRLGEAHGLSVAGYAPQQRFLANLGFASHLDALEAQRLSAARTELSRMAMMALVDPEQYGDLKVLVQAKGIRLDARLLGFSSDAC